MKKEVHTLSEKELANYPITDLVDGWYFRIQEISNGAFKVDGIDRWGRIVSHEGSEIELEQILQTCGNDAREINTELDEKSKTHL